MISAVIDTNVLVSALLSPSGNESLIVLAIQRRLVKPFFSEEILQEYAGVLARPKFAFPPDVVDSVISLIRSRGESVQAAPLQAVSLDPSDDRFLACAGSAGVEFIVTGNKRHFPERLGTVRVVSAGELLDRITLEL